MITSNKFFTESTCLLVAFFIGTCFAFLLNENTMLFDQNLVVFLDVINWENNQAMNNARIQIMNPQGQIIATHQNPRFKLTDAVAFTPNCIWIGMAGYNPVARAEPQLPLSTYQSVACIDQKTGKAIDFHVPGIAAGTPTPTTDGNAVIFSSSAKPVVILARDNKSIQVLDLAKIDPKIDFAVKNQNNHAHMNGFYYQVVWLGVTGSAVVKINERTLEPNSILRFPDTFIQTLVVVDGALVALEAGERSTVKSLLTLDENLNITKKVTTGVECLNGSTILMSAL